jgi:hypothetical protein
MRCKTTTICFSNSKMRLKVEWSPKIRVRCHLLRVRSSNFRVKSQNVNRCVNFNLVWIVFLSTNRLHRLMNYFENSSPTSATNNFWNIHYKLPGATSGTHITYTNMSRNLSCTNTSCKDDIVLNRWECLLRATEWPVTTVTVTHKMKWQKWKQIHLYHTISNTDNSGSNKRNEILPLHQEVVNRPEAHFTRPLRLCRSPFHTGEPNSQQARWKPVMKTLQNCVTRLQIPSTRHSKTQYKSW